MLPGLMVGGVFMHPPDEPVLDPPRGVQSRGADRRAAGPKPAVVASREDSRLACLQHLNSPL